MKFQIRNLRFLLLLLCLSSASADEIWLADNTRLYGLIQAVGPEGKLVVQLADGQRAQVAFDQIVSIRFLGRDPLLVQAGAQEFRFVNGGQIRGQIVATDKDALLVHTALVGPVSLSMGNLAGFVSLPLAGFSGRKAEELVESLPGERPACDVVLDQRGSTYAGIVRKISRTDLDLYHEELVRMVPIKVPYLAGVRLADEARDAKLPWKGDVQMRFWGRDGSAIQGVLKEIHLGRWVLAPFWNAQAALNMDLEEIAQVQVLGGAVQYLSQLTPAQVKERTTLAPPQPFRMDRSCQGESLSMAGKRYPWGIGVHADSELSFALGGQFEQFRCEAGIAASMGESGSVIFSVLGDGKELYASPLVRGGADKPLEIAVPVKGVKTLTLKVTDGGDLDLGDVANWGAARVVRAGASSRPAEK